METKYYHKNSDVVAFKKIKNSNGYSWEATYDERGNPLTFKNLDGYSWEYTYDERGNKLTYKNSGDYSSESTYDKKGNRLTYKDTNGNFEIKGQRVTKEEFEEFINNQNRPCVGKKVIVDGIEYELK